MLNQRLKVKLRQNWQDGLQKTFIVFVIKVLPIFLAMCAIHTVFSWIADIVEEIKRMQKMCIIL